MVNKVFGTDIGPACHSPEGCNGTYADGEGIWSYSVTATTVEAKCHNCYRTERFRVPEGFADTVTCADVREAHEASRPTEADVAACDCDFGCDTCDPPPADWHEQFNCVVNGPMARKGKR